MARSPRGGGSSRCSKSYWMCSCGGWNWDWRTSCLGCGYAAPPWAMGTPPAKARPKADKDGWVDQPRGRRAQRQARGAASRAASTKSQTSASAASGTPSGGGATAIERLQAAVEQLEALQAEPPDGVDGCFTDVVASQLEAKRAELVRAQKAAAEQKASPLPWATRPHREANAISKGEKRLRAARLELEQKQEARDLVEAQLQKAQEELAELDAEVEEATRALQVLEEAAREEAEALRRQRAAEWTGASQVPGLAGKVARAAIRAQMEAVRAQLEGAPVAPKRAPWAESCPMEEISSDDGDLADGGGPWQPQPAAERGPLGAASEGRSQGQRAPSEACAAGLRLHESGTEVVESDLVELHDMGVLDPPRGQERAAGPSCVLILLCAEENVVGALEFGTSEWSDSMGRAGVPGHPETMARIADPQQPTEQPLRARAQGREATAARCATAATGARRASPVGAVVRTQWSVVWCLEPEWCMVMDLGDEFDPMSLEPRAMSSVASTCALQAFYRHERRNLYCRPLLLWQLFGGAIGLLPRPGVERYVKVRHARGASIPNAFVAMRSWWSRPPVGVGRHYGKQYVDGSALSSEGFPPAGGIGQVQSAAAAEPPQAGEALGGGAPATRPRLEDSRSTGSSTAALSATAVAFSILGHVLSYACAGEGGDTQEIVACAKCGAYRVLGSHAGGKSRLKVQCPGLSYLTNKSGRNQRSPWERGPHPGGRPRADKQRVRAEGTPALRSQGPVPGRAQERYLGWLGMGAEPAGPSAGALGAGEAAEGERAAAGAAPGGGLVSRRVRRRLARRGSESSGSE
ncbi:unnamed protein product [Prorocentrum cordatum]|uniref:RanBP2-type domain-containing protein n=1 Tax=Prorocentrum cordatum TaxID=2364126 RepID=A0ABN9PDJ8_9DINO|nr:unnamed protein product [Polarella glacialis]